jgi:phosphatidylinositol-3-phosphatase
VALTSGTTGSNGVITSNSDPTVWPQSSVSIFEHLGTDAVQLAESQPSNCSMKGSGDFIINHSPLQYYTRINQTLCPTQAQALTSSPNLSAKYTLIIPNRCHDMHKCPTQPTIAARVKAGDQWASTFVPTLLSSAQYQAGKTAIFVTWDEGNLKSFQIPFIVISPYTPAGLKVTTRLDHYSMLKAVQQMLGDTPLLGHAADASTVSLAPAYGLQ